MSVDRIGEIEALLAGGADPGEVLDSLAIAGAPAPLAPNRAQLDAAFGEPSVAAIVAALDATRRRGASRRSRRFGR